MGQVKATAPGKEFHTLLVGAKTEDRNGRRHTSDHPIQFTTAIPIPQLNEVTISTFGRCIGSGWWTRSRMKFLCDGRPLHHMQRLRFHCLPAPEPRRGPTPCGSAMELIFWSRSPRVSVALVHKLTPLTLDFIKFVTERS